MLAIVENSPGLAAYFETFVQRFGRRYEVFPVYDGSGFPSRACDSYIFTGDFSNISDGLKPYHKEEIEFIRSIRGKRIFGSCFSHQLIAFIHGAPIVRREKRYFGWNRLTVKEEHQVFKGIEDPFFLSMNGDEVAGVPEKAHLLAESEGCRIQALYYPPDILTMQSHPELLLQDACEVAEKYGEGLRDRCEDLERIFADSRKHNDDTVCDTFMKNLLEWLG